MKLFKHLIGGNPVWKERAAGPWSEADEARLQRKMGPDPAFPATGEARLGYSREGAMTIVDSDGFCWTMGDGGKFALGIALPEPESVTA